MLRVAVGVGLLAGCGSDLTCALLEDPNNCYATEAAALAACIPLGATVTATLSDDRTTCTFLDGVTVVFDQPLTELFAEANSEYGISFNVYAPDGSTCGHLYWIENASNVLEITVGNQSVGFETPLDGDDWRLTCPSHTYTASAGNQLACQSPTVVVPGVAYSDLPFTIFLESVATPSPLFTCQ